MKKEELMIGDWVSVGYTESNIAGDYDVFYEQEKLTLDHFKFWADNDWNESDFAEFLKPIPLTAEILKKNGFLLHKSASYFKQYMWTTGGISDYADVYIEVGKDQQDNWRWDLLQFKLNFYSGEAWFLKKHYVHELQHALRLCGINKEIKL